MRRRTSKQEAGAGFSLFSYLDGLLCTMGALIIVLICISRGARFSHKNASGEQANGPTADELNEELKNSEWRTKHMLTSRDKTLKDLQGVRQDLGHIDDHMNRLRKELQELAAAEEALAKGGANSTDERLREDVVRLRRAVAQAQAEVADARKKADSRRPSYAIVPYQGPNQTRRRPIYVECTGERVILQPEGIELHPEDFAGPMGAGNPLAAALRAEREFIYEQQDANQLQEEPYPLLLIRPDGIDAYCAAREAMSSWQSDFGYELIDQDWKLEYQPPNAELAQIAQAAINEARVRQRFLARAMPREANKDPQWYRAGTHGVVADGSVGRGPGNGGRRGGGGGGGDLANKFAQRANRPKGTNGNGLGDGSGNGAGVGNGARGHSGAGDNPATAGYGSGTSGRPGGSGYAQGDYPNGPNPYEGLADGTGGQPGSIPSAPGAGGAGTRPGNPNARPGAGGGPGAMGPGGTELAKNGSTGPGGAMRGGNPNSPNGGTGDGTGNDSGNSENGAPDGQPGATGGMANARGAGGTAGAPNSNQSGGPSGGGGTEAGGQAGGQPGGAQSAATGGASTAGGSGSSNGTAGPSGGTMQTIQMGAQQQPGGPQTSGVSNRPSGKGAGSSGSGQAGSAQDSLAKSNGKDWALPEDARNAVPIARPLVVECRPDKLIVHADGPTSKVVKEIPLPGATADSINELVGTVSDQAATWGPAGRGMYWKPSLSMQVTPGGEARYADLQTLMADSGLDVRPVQAPPKQVVKPKRFFGLFK
ncbi:MAG TPA: hypothetical protein VGJ26_13820 [Pirellulales bacterium]|jgi:hypothetical protein